MNRNDKYCKFLESCGEEEPGYEESWGNGYKTCKKDVLEILEKHHDNDGFSSSVLIEKIEKL